MRVFYKGDIIHLLDTDTMDYHYSELNVPIIVIITTIN